MVNDVKQINPEVQVIKTSLKTGSGFDEVIKAIDRYMRDH